MLVLLKNAAPGTVGPPVHVLRDFPKGKVITVRTESGEGLVETSASVRDEGKDAWKLFKKLSKGEEAILPVGVVRIRASAVASRALKPEGTTVVLTTAD